MFSDYLTGKVVPQTILSTFVITFCIEKGCMPWQGTQASKKKQRDRFTETVEIPGQPDAGADPGVRSTPLLIVGTAFDRHCSASANGYQCREPSSLDNT